MVNAMEDTFHSDIFGVLSRDGVYGGRAMI